MFYYPNRQTGGNSKQRKLFSKDFFSEVEGEREACIVCLSMVFLSSLLWTICASMDCAQTVTMQEDEQKVIS